MPNSTVDQISEAVKCLNLLGKRDKLAAKIYFMLNRAATLGTVPTNGVSALASLAACNNNLPETFIDSMFVAIQGQKAVSAGSAVSATDINALKAGIACLKIYGEPQLRSMELFLADRLP